MAASLRLTPQVAAALAANLPGDPGGALAAAREVVWPRSARIVHHVHRIGLESLLRMPPTEVPVFFERFFTLPDEHRWTYLTARDDVGGTAAAMNSLFWASKGRMRRHLVGSAVYPLLPAR